MRALILAAAAAAAFAAGPAAAASVRVGLNHTARLGIGGSASSVVVGNPAIADVTVVDSHTLFVSGRGLGATDVTVIDPAGRTLWSGEVDVVGGSQGHVAVYRGAQRSDLACAPGCRLADAGGNGGGESGPANPAAAAATGAATTAGSLAGASMVAHALAPS